MDSFILKSFLQGEHHNENKIFMNSAVNEWKKKNRGEIPKICIDLNSMVKRVTKDQFDIACGGRHQVALNMWRKMLFSMKELESRLIFFTELTLQEHQINAWIKRRNERFEEYKTLYETIEAEQTLPSIDAQDECELIPTSYGFELIAQEFGEIHYATQNDRDFEMIQYAKRENVMAIITNNMDVLIHNGSWRIWISDDIHITPTNRLKCLQFTQEYILSKLSLTQQQLPLFATLLGNNLTKPYKQLSHFHRSLAVKWMHNIVPKVAQYVRALDSDEPLDAQIARITETIFGTDPNLQEVIKNSLQSYNIIVAPSAIDDPLEKILLSTDMSMYRSYMENKSSIQIIDMPFYDMPIPILTAMLTDWMRRRIGVLRFHNRDDNYHFTLLSKLDLNTPAKVIQAKPLYPNYLPPLQELYLETPNPNPNYSITDIKWTLLKDMMQLTDKMIDAIRSLPTDVRLISTTLWLLVSNFQINIEEADGILYTELKIYNIIESRRPPIFRTKHIRAAHLYNITFGHVRNNFAIVGLLPEIERTLRFDGVFFQDVMEKILTLTVAERVQFILPFEQYRLYSIMIWFDGAFSRQTVII